MLKDIIGAAFAVISIFFLLVVTPNFYTGAVQWARSESEAIANTRNLIDEVIDTRELTEDTLADFNIKMAALSEYYTCEIIRKVKVINPDPLNPGQTYTTYIIVDDISQYNQGDLIVVNVEQIGGNMYQNLARKLMGSAVQSDTITLCGRVR